MENHNHAVIFDWNGTLIADTALALRGTNKALEAFNLPPITMKKMKEESTIPLDKLYIAIGCSKEDVVHRRDELFKAFGDCYESQADNLKLRRGAKETISFLKKQNYKVAILSNYAMDRIIRQVKRLGLFNSFDEILANRPDELYGIMHKQSKGERLKNFIKKYNIKQALIVGDTPEEIEIANEYNFLSIALTGGVCSTKRLRKSKPDFLINSLNEISKIAKEVFEVAK